ncbi:major capsid protein [Desulfohalovibrio reitneri]|uniref:major capsid protein n=1 Tax=Desulfohalovibrio reitneri TaxID=1307759 RepID=UPI0004A72A35|nr:major capsid protein [Desulfohalovibrio reitneri]
MTINDLRQFYTPAAVAARLKSLPKLKTSILDLVYQIRRRHPFAMVAAEDITELGVAQPLVMRGAPSLRMGGSPTAVGMYEPYEVSLHRDLTAAAMNDLKQLGRDGIQTHLANLDDSMRRASRATAEGIAATSLTGTISWPVQNESGSFQTYEVQFGSPHSHTPSTLWDAAEAKIRQVFADLQAMETLITDSGYASTVVFLAGSSAYTALLALSEAYAENPRAKLRVDVSEEGISIGGYLVKRMSEKYRNPQTGVSTPKVPSTKICAVGTDAPFSLFYCAIDDLDGKLQPLPYFSKPVKLADPSVHRIIGKSKPFPVPVVKAICWATVTSA